jgi:probable F420-dependent oxidoreductase
MRQRPFRFSAQVPDIGGEMTHWRSRLARIEDMGFATVALADHFTEGYESEPFVTLTAAAASTAMRVQTAVLGVDYRHPVLVHRMAATLDVISEGRLELGLGAGWMRAEYAAAGLDYDRPGVRIDRLSETVAILKGLFSGQPLTFKGEHYLIDGLVGVPRSVQRPHPPLLVGGGGSRVLHLAGREADIAGINANLGAGDDGRHSVLDVGWESMAEKVRWVNEGGRDAGRDPDTIELSMAQWLLCVDESRTATDGLIAKMAGRLDVDADWLEAAPGVLVGSVARCVDKLEELRQRLGISYIQIHAGPHQVDLDAVAPVIEQLAGR